MSAYGSEGMRILDWNIGFEGLFRLEGPFGVVADWPALASGILAWSPIQWFGGWWDGLSFSLQFFYAIGVVALLLLLFQVILLIVGSGELDFGEGEAGFLSLRAVAGFLLGFGWIGAISMENGFGLLAAVVFGAFAGGALMGGVTLVMLGLHRMRTSGTLNYENAVGAVGTVYLPIPPRQEGAGKVEVYIQGRSVIVPAYTRHGERIGNQQRVRVAGMIDPRTLLVEPLVIPLSGSPDDSVSGSSKT
jgi:hypothetical protein